MKMVVIGGHGLIGSRVVERLLAQGHNVLPASRRSGVDVVSGHGLDEVLDGAEVVVDSGNAPTFEDPDVTAYFQRATTQLLAACERAGVAHYVGLSVVGTPYLQDSAYFRAKAVQEALARQARIPATLVRATQCFEFMAQLVPPVAGRDVLHLSPAKVQPVAADDLALLVAQVATAPPAGHMVQIAGPERHRLFELVEWVMYFNQDQRPVVADPQARYYGALLKDATLTAEPGAALGTTRFIDWLASHVPGTLPHVHLPNPLPAAPAVIVRSSTPVTT
ncbi:SDR family oxidoreductase [Stenotrophomonas sp. AB1(2024)]|uniref:SDR family oxidoreductase n=1 Tax=Stenotrophomonas sp. AB1(2024) TaxID=3132215 RepID=UPI00309DC060